MTAILYLSVALIVMSGVGFTLTGMGLFLQSTGGGILFSGLALLGLSSLTVAVGCMFGLVGLAMILIPHFMGGCTVHGTHDS